MKRSEIKKLISDSTAQIERFTPDISQGLSDEQVFTRINEKNQNSVSEKFSKSYLSIIKDNLFNFFNFLGLVVCVSLILIRASISRFFFVAIYLANIAIGIIQEIRAKRCIDKLSLMSEKTVTVIRNGKNFEILSRDIVLDDVFLINPGEQVPTDSIILEGEIEVNESLLTGESIPVKKTVGDTLFAGSFIISGRCTLRADKVGKENYIEKLSAKAKRYKKPHSELMKSLQIIIKSVGAIIIPITLAFILKSIIFYNVKTFEIIDRACTIVIGMIPSGMFLLTSVALAVGVIKLANQNTLVQDLYSLEMLARVDTICFDKTGTLTDGRMNVDEIVLLKDEQNVNNIMSTLLAEMTSNNQTEIALRDYFGADNNDLIVQVLQFNSQRKFACATFNNGHTYAFGAPEFILAKDEYEKIVQKVDHYALHGYRVILLAESRSKIKDDTAPDNFKPIALILLTDHVREDAITTIQWFKDNDVSVKVISGDNPVTVSVIAQKAGIENADKYISLEGLSDTEIMEIADKYTVFGRVTPEQKAVLIKSIKNVGHVTAMTGDGVNDILALKEADCAISVGSGSQAAKNISHLVLLDNNFSVMPNVVYEGRRVINNVQNSSSLFLMKTMFTIFFAIISLFMPTVPTYPFKLSQMILMEFFIIGVASFILSLQPNDKRVSGTFMSRVLANSFPYAMLMVLSVIIVEIFKAILGTTDVITTDVYSTMNVIVLNFSALICLLHACKPFNKTKKIMFLIIFSIILFITLLAIFNGVKLLDLRKMVPLFPEMWHHLLIVICIILMDIPLSSVLIKASNKLFNKK